jgi:2-polyprenyl-3-methyl-5-hydroxy-6-metoxy-1,4-benzoquinol methylase
MTTSPPLTEREQQRRDALADRLFDASRSALDLFCVYLGDRLGLYRALAGRGATTPEELAEAAEIHPRYAREWLEQQAVGGILEIQDGRFTLPPGHAEALADPESESFSAHLARSIVSLVGPLPQLMAAFRSGGGVPWSAYGDDGREAQESYNRVMFLNHLGSEWIPSMPDVHARLQAPGARVADLACGAGWSSIAIARAYPDVRVDGYDGDAASVELARANAEAEELSDRVRFVERDVSAGEEAGGYDLVCVFEAIHDMARPVEALAGMRALAAPDGAVLVMDERTNDRLTVGDPQEHYLYGVSVLGCLPCGMSEQPSAATGTVMRRSTFARYAEQAGFDGVEVLDIEHDAFRFYRLR